jgi:hypothetical protein
MDPFESIWTCLLKEAQQLYPRVRMYTLNVAQSYHCPEQKRWYIMLSPIAYQDLQIIAPFLKRWVEYETQRPWTQEIVYDEQSLRRYQWWTMYDEDWELDSVQVTNDREESETEETEWDEYIGHVNQSFTWETDEE